MRRSPTRRKRRRIVSLAPSVTSILLELGARRELVAVSRWCREVGDVRGLPELGDCWAMDAGALERLRPTLVVGSVPYRREVVERLLEYPAPFLATNPRSLGDIYEEIRLLGAVVGREAEARRLAARMRRELRRIAAPARAKRRRVRVYAEAWPNPRISSPPWVEELVEMAGGKMVTPAGSRVSDEQVRRARPEAIVLAWAATGERARPEQMLLDPAWRSVPAVRNGRVGVVPDHWLNTPGPPLVKGLRALMRLLHPGGSRGKTGSVAAAKGRAARGRGRGAGGGGEN